MINLRQRPRQREILLLMFYIKALTFRRYIIIRNPITLLIVFVFWVVDVVVVVIVIVVVVVVDFTQDMPTK